VIARVGSLREAVEQAPKQASGAIEVAVDDERVAWEGLTLRAPKDGRVLVRNLTLSIPHGTCVLIVGPNTIAKMALFRATAGIWSAGHGRIFRPGLENMLFLPERPYLPPGDLREVLVRTGREDAVAEARILDVLRALGVDSVVAQAGGLGVEQDWDDLLSLGEQQLLAFARLILAAPRFAFLDRVSTALGPAEIERALRVLFGRGITYLTCADGDDAPLLYDTVLEIEADGSWSTSSMGTARRAR
jgi:putative ATP-binding cassette transporter